MTHEAAASDDARIDIGALTGALVRKLPRIVLVTLALLVATFVILMFQPRLYESGASILVEPRANSFTRPSTEQASSAVPVNTAGVISSQIELIKSRDTLLNVIDELDLRSVPEFNGSQAGFSPLSMVSQLIGRSTTTTPNSIDEVVLNNLYERLTVLQERDSAIISVLVRSTDPQLAADIANAVAYAHVARRAELSLSDTAEASGWLLDEINRLRGTVRDAESDVANFRVDNDLFTGQNNTSLPDQQLSTISAQIAAAQERKNAALSRASLIRDLLDRGQSIEGVADVRESAVIQQLSQEKARLQGELAQRSATLLSGHPTILALNAQIAELDNQVRQEGQSVAAALEAEAQIESDVETSLQADLDRAKQTASTATIDNVTLDSLNREATAQRDLLEAYLLRYNEASARVESNSALPDVRVVSIAAPAVAPSSPKTALIMIAVGLVAFLVQVGAVIFNELLSGRALTPLVAGRAAQSPQDRLETVPFDEAELEPEQQYEEPAPIATAAIVEPVPADPVYYDVPEPEFEPAFEPDEEPTTSENEDRFSEPLLEEPDFAEPEPETIVDPEPYPPTGLALDDFAEPEQPLAIPAEPAIGLLRYADLVSDLVLGRTHLLLLADHGQSQPSAALAEELVGDALAKGLSVALLDAGTGRQSEAPGITDLSNGSANFGDVVQKSADNSFAEVTWGQGDAVNRTSNRPITLAEALSDIYEVVVVLTGRVDRKSMLGAFAELGGRVVLVADDEDEAEAAEDIRLRLEEAGLPRVEIAAFAQPVAA